MTEQFNYHNQGVLVSQIPFDSFTIHPSLPVITLGKSCADTGCRLELINVFMGWPTLVCPCVGVHRRTSLVSSSFLPQQFPACLIWMVCKMRGKWPYSCCFVRCCFQDIFNAASLCSSHLPFSPGVTRKSKCCDPTVVLTWLQLRRISILFYRRNQIFMWLLTCYHQSTLFLCIYWHYFQSMRYCYWGMWTFLLISETCHLTRWHNLY